MAKIKLEIVINAIIHAKHAFIQEQIVLLALQMWIHTIELYLIVVMPYAIVMLDIMITYSKKLV